MVEVVTHTPDGPRVGVDGLGLQALEFEVFEVGLVALIKFSTGAGFHAGGPGEMLQNRPNRIEGAKMQNKSREDWGGLLRVAASSNPAMQGTVTSGASLACSCP